MRLRGEMYWGSQGDEDWHWADVTEFVATSDRIAFKVEFQDGYSCEGSLPRVAGAYGGMTCAGSVTLKDDVHRTEIQTGRARCMFQKKAKRYLLQGVWTQGHNPQVTWRAELREIRRPKQ
jgi:hypothetical protein